MSFPNNLHYITSLTASLSSTSGSAGSSSAVREGVVVCEVADVLFSLVQLAGVQLFREAIPINRTLDSVQWPSGALPPTLKFFVSRTRGATRRVMMPITRKQSMKASRCVCWPSCS